MSGVVAAKLVSMQRHPVAPHISTGIIGAEKKGFVGGPIRKAAHSHYCGKVGDYRHHSYLGQLWEFADILPTYVKGLNVTLRGYRHNRTRVRHTKGYATRYETTEGDVGSRI